MLYFIGFIYLSMKGRNAYYPPELAERIEKYCEEKGLEKFTIAARRLTKIGLETEEKRK